MVEFVPFAVRFLHITAGILWIGGAILWSAVIMPRVTQQVPPSARGPFVVNLGPVVASYLTNAGYVTILTGLLNVGVLYGWGNFFAAFQDGAWGAAMGVGLLLSIAAVGVAHAIIKPTLKEMIAMIKAMPAGPPPAAAGSAPPGPPPRMAALGKKMMMASVITMLLAVIVVGAMAFAVASVRTG